MATSHVTEHAWYLTTDDAPARWRMLTLDTSCVSALANPQTSTPAEQVEALDRLVDCARNDLVRLQLTVAYERDFGRWEDTEGRAQRLAWLAQAPPMPRVGGVLRSDVSEFDGLDGCGEDVDEVLDGMFRALLPGVSLRSSVPPFEEAPEHAAKVFSDIDHLMAHRRSGADAFVTLDERTILSRAWALADLAIIVCWPTEALRHVRSANGS